MDMMMTLDRVRTAPPIESFEITMYALTRRTKAGGTEFATEYEGWTSDIDHAHMFDCAHLIDYKSFNGIDKKGSEKSEVTFTVDVYHPDDFPDERARANTTNIIVARSSDFWNPTISKPIKIVTYGGGFGRNNQITTDVSRAVPFSKMTSRTVDDWQAVCDDVRKTTDIPMRMEKRSGHGAPVDCALFPAIRHAVIMPAPQR